MIRATLGTAIAVALVVGTFETVQHKYGAGGTWQDSLRNGFCNPTTFGAAAAGLVAGYLLSR